VNPGIEPDHAEPSEFTGVVGVCVCIIVWCGVVGVYLDVGFQKAAENVSLVLSMPYSPNAY
jgi:hypothetical protein